MYTRTVTRHITAFAAEHFNGAVQTVLASRSDEVTQRFPRHCNRYDNMILMNPHADVASVWVAETSSDQGDRS